MSTRSKDYEVSPLTDRLNLDEVIVGLSKDLLQLREGKITVTDAIARSLLAKQLFNGVRLHLNAQKFFSDTAKNAVGVKSIGAA